MSRKLRPLVGGAVHRSGAIEVRGRGTMQVKDPIFGADGNDVAEQ
jgi:hypothetical protein